MNFFLSKLLLFQIKYHYYNYYVHTHVIVVYDQVILSYTSAGSISQSLEVDGLESGLEVLEVD